MTSPARHDYLWDRSGPVDPEVARLEEILGTLRHDGRLLDLQALGASSPVRGRSRAAGVRPLHAAAGIAALLVLAGTAALGWVTFVQPRIGWAVQAVDGTPIIDGEAIGGASRLGIGRWLTTDDRSRARIAVGQIGHVDVEPNTRVQIVESRAREHRMTLAEGVIHARIWAPPRFFYVNTPAAVAVDLGCAYTLQVNRDGSGLVRVTHGWVGFEHGGREAFIPEGAVCATRAGIGPGTPRYEDAPLHFADALGVLDFAPSDNPGRTAALDSVLASARPRDALTLWHLLQRGSASERARVFDRMAIVAPPPDGVTREAVLAGQRRAIDRWWNSLGLDSATWWRLWKKEW